MKKTIHFINLSSGADWLETHPHDFRFVRIQSTACEQKRWSFIIEDLDYDFLIHAALGHECVVWDTSARKQVSRALYQGLPWIRYCMERQWFRAASIPTVRGVNVTGYFSSCFDSLSTPAAKKLEYARKFLATDTLQLAGVCRQSSIDGDYEQIREILSEKPHLMVAT